MITIWNALRQILKSEILLDYDYFIMEKVKRLISWFDRATDDLKGEKDIDNIKLDQLKEIFSPPSDDPLMIYVYPITEKEAGQLKKLIDLEFIFDKYIYQLDCFKADV